MKINASLLPSVGNDWKDHLRLLARTEPSILFSDDKCQGWQMWFRVGPTPARCSATPRPVASAFERLDEHIDKMVLPDDHGTRL